MSIILLYQSETAVILPPETEVRPTLDFTLYFGGKGDGFKVGPIYVGDFLTTLQITCVDSKGIPLNLKNREVYLYWKPYLKTKTRKGPLTVVSETGGIVSYDLSSLDILTPGDLQIEGEIVTNSRRKLLSEIKIIDIAVNLE